METYHRKLKHLENYFQSSEQNCTDSLNYIKSHAEKAQKMLAVVDFSS